MNVARDKSRRDANRQANPANAAHRDATSSATSSSPSLVHNLSTTVAGSPYVYRYGSSTCQRLSICVISGCSRELLSLFLPTWLGMITGLEGRLTNNTNSQTNLRPLLEAFILVFQVFSQTFLLSLRLASCSLET